jgi:hypothetical protein
MVFPQVQIKIHNKFLDYVFLLYMTGNKSTTNMTSHMKSLTSTVQTSTKHKDKKRASDNLMSRHSRLNMQHTCMMQYNIK